LSSVGSRSVEEVASGGSGSEDKLWPGGTGARLLLPNRPVSVYEERGARREIKRRPSVRKLFGDGLIITRKAARMIITNRPFPRAPQP
jgi:hypothetical protein